MSYYRKCQYCGAHLDPGERCDCKNEQKPEQKPQIIKIAYKKEKKEYVG